MPEAHEERCRQLAPRFAALRGEHQLRRETGGQGYVDEICTICGHGGLYGEALESFCQRTDGDALDEAIVACGWIVSVGKGVDGAKGYEALIYNHNRDLVSEGFGATSREAKSAALWHAVFS